ncbi:class I SAM-dependent DNA methyltransferase [Halobacillus campisalis]|uniref:Class I SAM-dependent DNA methyltransferase n=1 Tax=Halobacillus campisalis TaxID=435909 RepID=A0ABW2K473_9BACI|nr:class I SAM-dependent methyltransferase [Halobacillus campisalis]
MSYQQIAEVYDRLMQDAPYENWEAWTKRVINSYHPDTNRILDLGCGTGEITLRLAGHYQMTGVDLSEDMLAVATSKDNAKTVQWLRQDITQLDGLYGFDCVFSFCDVLNYITDEKKLEDVFIRAYDALKADGLFLFDVHSVEHIVQHLYGQTFAEVYDEISYIWFCDPGESEYSLVHDLTFFVQNNEGHHVRFDETHFQRGYSTETLKQLLNKAGFDIESITSDFSNELNETGDRLFFVCRKKEREL